jgi:long-chain acyl-CoA synthetase
VRERATLLYGSPLQFARMAHAGRRARLDTVRLALSTTAALPPETASAFEAACGVPLGQAYGIIEAGCRASTRAPSGEPAESVGRAVPGYEVAIVTADGALEPAGAVGEVGIRGTGLFSGYHRPWQPRASLLGTAGSSPATSARSTRPGGSRSAAARSRRSSSRA